MDGSDDVHHEGMDAGVPVAGDSVCGDVISMIGECGAGDDAVAAGDAVPRGVVPSFSSSSPFINSISYTCSHARTPSTRAYRDTASHTDISSRTTCPFTR